MPCRADTLASGILLAMGWRTPCFRAFLAEHRAQFQFVLLVLFLGLGALLWWFVQPLNAVSVSIGITWLAAFFSCQLVVVLSQTDGWMASLTSSSALRAIGTISYCVYIIHDTFNRLAHRILLHAEPQIYNARGVGVTLYALLLTLAVASLSWRFFEKPLMRRGHSHSYGEATAG